MIVDCAVYESGRRLADAVPVDDALDSARRSGDAFVWLGLHEPSADEFDAVALEFGLHPLAVEDAVHAHQRPKLEVYGDSAFFVVKTATYVDRDEVVTLGDIMVFVGSGFVVTVRHGEHSGLREVRRELEAQPDLLKAGPWAVLHAIVDKIVDEYEAVLEDLDRDIDEIEEQVFSDARSDHAQRIFKLRREVLDFRRAAQPLVDPLDDLANARVRACTPELAHFFRDVHDHALRVADRVEALDSILGSALSANLAQVGVRQNEDMRKISAWVAIAAVPTMIAGIYGMNFDYMPELEWKYGYALVVGVMAVACGLMYREFKRRGWL